MSIPSLSPVPIHGPLPGRWMVYLKDVTSSLSGCLPLTWRMIYYSSFKSGFGTTVISPGWVISLCVHLQRLLSWCLSVECLPIALVKQGPCSAPAPWTVANRGTVHYGLPCFSACNLQGDHKVALATRHWLLLTCPGCSSSTRYTSLEQGPQSCLLSLQVPEEHTIYVSHPEDPNLKPSEP